MRLEIRKNDKTGTTTLEVSQAVGGVRVGIVRQVTNSEIDNSIYLSRSFIARKIVEMRREVRRIW